MHDIHLYLKKLTEYFDAKTTTTEQIKAITCNSPPSFDVIELINCLTEICTECRQTRESDVFDNTHDSWEYFSKIVSIPHLVAFFSGLLELTAKDASNFMYRKVAITACRTYVLLLTSPGAKIFDAFEPDVLQKVFKAFHVIKDLGTFRDHERVQLQMLVIMLLEDFQLYLKHVSFEEYEDLQMQFIDSIIAVMDFHHEKGLLNKYSFQIQEQCYNMLDHVCLPIHGSEITPSLMMILNGSACLTRFTRPCAGTTLKPKYALITDWFIEMLKHLPRQTCATLTCYIQAILTDTDVTGNKDLLSRYLDICAQYDAAMVRICGESTADFLEQLSSSKESQHRTNCVELISRMLVLDTKCNWEIFRSELPKIPREIKLIRILLQKTYDANNVVSMKAINAFLKIVHDGNATCKEILTKCFDQLKIDKRNGQTTDSLEFEAETNETPKVNNEHREEETQNEATKDTTNGTENTERPEESIDLTKSQEYKDLFKEISQNLVLAVRIQLKNSSALVRRVAILLLEFVASTSLSIDDLLQSFELRQLYIDQSSIVRRQLVLSLDQILNLQPTNEAAIMAWIKIVLDLANDVDQKVQETVVESFKRNIFDKIQKYEKSSSLSHVFPWRLLNRMLNCGDCPDFRISMQRWMNKNLLTAKTLSKIETHLDTNNATEAWILLAMVAPSIQGHNPERVSSLLLQNLKYDMTNTIENCYIQLEVLSFWLKYLNNPSKNEIKRLITEMLVSGSLRPRNINRAFGICYKLSAKSGDTDRDEFIRSVRNACETYILANQNAMFVPNLCDDRLISYMYLYSEVGSVLESILHEDIVNFFFVFLRTAGSGQLLTVRNDSMLCEKIVCILSVLTGLSSFNPEICAQFVPLLGKVLRTIDHNDVCFTAIKCLGFLCKKNTAVVEAIVPYILLKTQHTFANIREFAMKTLATLILEDYLKFRGTLLVYVLAGMLDQKREIKELSTELIMKYTLEKNDIFLRTCLLECPFVFNSCSCFGQTTNQMSQSSNILKGPTKQPAREYIYRYLIRKVDSLHLYMYFGHLSRLADYIEKESRIADSSDIQASIVDFFFICTEICIANEKHKKNLAKIMKEKQPNDESALSDNELISQDDAMASNSEIAVAETDTNSKGRRGKKNQPTMAQALAVVEKIVPHIVSIDAKLRPINGNLFGSAIDRLCNEMCIHFGSLLEYAQPRTFWAKYLKKAKKTAPSTSSKRASRAMSVVSESATSSPSTSRKSKSKKSEENDSGQFTIEDIDGDDSASQCTQSSVKTTPTRSSKKSRKRYVSSSSGRGADDQSDISSCIGESESESVASTKQRASRSNKRRQNSLPETPSSRKTARHRK